MRKLSRILLLATAAIIALASMLLIAANLYVQSQATQARIQQEVSQRFGTGIQIRRISVTPWGGLKLSGITIAQTTPAPSGDFLAAKTFRLRVRLLSFFSKRLVIKEVSLVDPIVVWPQNPEGKWRLPGAREEPAAEPEAQAPAVSAGATPEQENPPTASATPLPPVASKPAREKIGHPFEPDVRRFTIAGGNFRFLNRAQTAVATFDDVDFHCRVSPSRALRGEATIAKVSLRDRFFLEQVRSPLRYDAGELELSKVMAKAADGEINGRFVMQPEAPDSPFSVDVKFRQLEANQIVQEAGGPSGVIQGKLDGSLTAQGKTADTNALTGSGEIFLRDGQLRQYSLLVALGQILQIEELTQLHLEQAEGRYHITPGLITVDQLVLRSTNIRLSAHGTVGFNGKLQLNSQLAINEKVRGQLFRQIRQNFHPLEETGLSAVDFEITGTVERPKSNLVERVVGRDLKDLGSVINSFLGGGKSERPKRKKAAQPSPEESAAESPTPAPPSASPRP